MNCKNAELRQAMRIEDDLRDRHRLELVAPEGATVLPKLVCLVLNHRWEMRNDVNRGDWKLCTRCGKEQDFHPGYDREGSVPDKWTGASGSH